MPTQQVAYRFRVRNKENTSDVFSVTSSTTGGNRYIVEPPNIDGSTFDPLTGVTSIGAATILVVDPALSSTVRFITQHLGSASANPQLIGRLAFIDIDRGSGFTGYFSGFVTGISLVDGITYQFNVTHTTKDDETLLVYQFLDDARLTARPYLLGGPVSATVPTTNDARSSNEGTWKATVQGSYTTFWHVDINENTSSAFPPADLLSTWQNTPWAKKSKADRQRDVFRWARENSKKYSVFGAISAAAATEWANNPARFGAQNPIQGWCPRIAVDIVKKNGSSVSYRGYLMSGYSSYKDTLFWEDLGNHMYIAKDPDGPAFTLSANDTIEFYASPLDVSEAAPAWHVGHPADLLADVLEMAGYSVNAASVNTTKTNVGDVTLALRIVEPMTLSDAIKMLCGAFGMGVRFNLDGTRSLFCWRTRKTPVATITDSDLLARASQWYSIDESSVIRSVKFKKSKFTNWPGGATNAQGEPGSSTSGTDRPLDGIVATDEEITGKWDALLPLEETAVFPDGGRTLNYNFPGEIYTPTGEFLQFTVSPFDTWTTQTLAIYAYGAQVTEIEVQHGVTAEIGDEVMLELSARPGINGLQTPTAQRNTPEQCVVIGRTPTPYGAKLRLLGTRVTEPAPTGPGDTPPGNPSLNNAFTLAKGTPSSRNVNLTLVSETGWQNVGELEVQYRLTAPPDAEAAGTDWETRWAPPGTFTIGPFPPASQVWVRVRTFFIAYPNTGQQWTAYQNITLDTDTSSPPDGVVQTPAIAWAVNTTTGKVSASVRVGTEAVKVYMAASTTAFPSTAAILAGSSDSAAPFEFADITTISDQQIGYLGAIAEDAKGNKSVPGFAAASYPFSASSPGVMGLPGPSGPPGASGASGPTGATGPAGVMGLPGPQGPSGTNGATGPTGSTGPTGVAGVMGLPGPSGLPGSNGATGATGVSGATGPAGIQGPSGATGPQGVTGPTGPAGVMGLPGPTGFPGQIGLPGPSGLSGATGATGLQGLQGVQGVTGATGVQGPQGVQGATGPQGAQGPQGVTGPQGVQGATGATGVQGITGPTGPNYAVTISTSNPSGSGSTNQLWAKVAS